MKCSETSHQEMLQYEPFSIDAAFYLSQPVIMQILLVLEFAHLSSHFRQKIPMIPKNKGC